MATFILFIIKFLNIYMFVIFASVVLSWLVAFNIVNLRNRFVLTIADILYRLTEPVYRPIKRILPNTGPVDFSPMVVLFIIYILQNILYGVLYSSYS